MNDSIQRAGEHALRLKADQQSRPLNAFIYDLRQLQRQAAQWKAALPAQCRAFYAIKANSEAPILKALLPIVDGFEVASIGEVARVRAVDGAVPIIFGGPGKTNAELDGALAQRVSLIHVESLHEIDRLAWIARNRGVVAAVLLRVNLRGPLPAGTLQMAGAPTQFGVDESDLDAAVARIKQYPQLALKGFHLHSLSNNLDVDSHSALIACYLERFRAWKQRYGPDLTVLNAGGGIGVNYEQPGRQFPADVFAARLRDQLVGADGDPATLIFECGRYLAASCGYYATEVLDIRRKGGEAFVVTAGGLHHFLLPGAWKHSHPFAVVPVERWDYPFPRLEARDLPLTIVGSMNSPRDVLARQAPAAAVRIGDIILFTHAGAYGWSISAHDFSSLPYPLHMFAD
ncbi:MAG TPA: type III PLP-dependent enzyme [Herpetosiphonaceae bacterium]|nr:type III PLP-dependent enzyme [Herpetosiphonaceae bacterium]